METEDYSQINILIENASVNTHTNTLQIALRQHLHEISKGGQGTAGRWIAA